MVQRNPLLDKVNSFVFINITVPTPSLITTVSPTHILVLNLGNCIKFILK